MGLGSYGELFLGLIALATVITAVVELILIAGLLRVASRMGQVVDRISVQAASLRAHASAIESQVLRAKVLAHAQLDRVALAYDLIAQPAERIAGLVAVVRCVSGVLARR